MDAITVSRESAIRALIPLVIALLGGVVLTLALSVGYRLLRRRKAQAAEAAANSGA
jgi:flagellar biosynthesis/type III secretory pathway M-ring protein FliF/YscJ